MNEIWYAVELVIAETPEALSDYVRVNARDAASFRISAVEPGLLARERMVDTFS